MPSPRAVLNDIEEQHLDPKLDHKLVTKAGHLCKKSEAPEVLIEKPVKNGLVELPQSVESSIVDAPSLSEVVTSADVEQPVVEQVVEKKATKKSAKKEKSDDVS